MDGCNKKIPLRTAYVPSDFLFFWCISLVPEVIACVAIARDSWLWMGIYIAAMVPFMFAEVGFLCRHCPYYSQLPGRTVHCKSHWGPTKYFRPKPGRIKTYEKFILYFLFACGFAFPFYWLIQEPVLLVLYLWSIVNFVWTYAKYECPRCLYFDCPFNFVSKEARKELLNESTVEKDSTRA